MPGPIPRNVKARKMKKSRKITQGPQNGLDSHESGFNVVSPQTISQSQGPDGPLSLVPLSTTLASNQPGHVTESHADGDVPPGRIFSTLPYGRHFTLADIEVKSGHWSLVACPSSHNKCPCCMQYNHHNGWLIVSIAGACINNGPDQALARSAISVFFGMANQNNIAATLHEARHTTQIAELKACISALQRAIALWKIATPKPGDQYCYPMRLLVIKSDSSYIVEGVTEWLPKWKENGWKSCKGQKVANDELWRVIDRWIEHLESEVRVQFWLVTKEENTIAELMVRSALKNA